MGSQKVYSVIHVSIACCTLRFRHLCILAAFLVLVMTFRSETHLGGVGRGAKEGGMDLALEPGGALVIILPRFLRVPSTLLPKGGPAAESFPGQSTMLQSSLQPVNGTGSTTFAHESILTRRYRIRHQPRVPPSVERNRKHIARSREHIYQQLSYSTRLSLSVSTRRHPRQRSANSARSNCATEL